MPFQLSPGVLVVEKDLTNIIPAVATSIGGFVGDFQWGPVLEATTISSELDLVKVFGKPNTATYASFYSAANFLAYGNNLQVVRVIGTAATNAVSLGTAALIQNSLDWEANYSTGTNAIGEFAAKYPGTMGNSLRVSMADSRSFTGWEYENEFDAAPGTSDFVADAGGSNDEVHIIVIDEDGFISGVPGTVLEKFPFASKAFGAKTDNGSSNYYKVILENNSKFVWWTDHPAASLSSAPAFDASDALVVVLAANTFNIPTHNFKLGDEVLYNRGSGGTVVTGLTDATNYFVGTVLTNTFVLYPTRADAIASTNPMDITGLGVGAAHTFTLFGVAWGSTATTSNYRSLYAAITHSLTGGVTDLAADTQDGWDMFINAETLDVNLLFVGAAALVDVQYVIQNVADVRRDCVVFCSPLLASVFNRIDESTASAAVIADRGTTLNVNSSYAVMDSGWKYQYDKYNDVYRWIPLNADIAGLCARTDYTNDPWWSPAGLNRGQIKNVVKLAWSPGKAYRDNLYKNGINPVISTPGQGTYLYGDKTLLSKPSAFDRINVRRLFIVLEKAIATASKYQLFEFNDSFTRAQFRNMIEPFLRDVKGRRGIIDFRVVCDETNNTGEVIDRNEFIADIYIKPARSINFITLNFIATRTGVEFSEIVGA